MNSMNERAVKETFSRLFVVAKQNKANLFSFTCLLGRSLFVHKIEGGVYDDYFNKSLENVFFDVTNKKIGDDDSYGVYDDAYWAGSAYFEMFLRLRKPFSYLFIKLPLSKLLDIYPIYHEMDITSLLEYFLKIEKEKTILRLLCEQSKCSLTTLSYGTGISLTTLSKYNASDDALYKGSFQNIMAICGFFKVPNSLFMKRIIGQLNEKFIEIFGDNYKGYYQSTRISCRGIIIKNNNILLSYETKTDQWMIPGGGLEKGEDEVDCVTREIGEETGTKVKADGFALEIDEYYGEERFISKYFLCEVIGDTNISLTEREIEAGMELRWIPLEESFNIFSSHQKYINKDEMRRGMYLREYLALRRIVGKK